MYDIVIIGAGIAGLTAAIYVARAGRSVLILEQRIKGGQIVTSSKIANWPGEPGISGMELMEKIHKQAVDLGAEIRYESVEKVVDGGDSMRFKIKTDEAEYECGAVIIATGTEPRKLSEKQAEYAGARPISYCATCDGAFYAGKPVVVVGSGNTAKHEAEYLEKIASKVYHIHHDDPIPEDAVAVFVTIGRVPETEVFKKLVELDEAGYVVAGEDCHTSYEGVFAAGDCRTKSLRQLITAAADGAVAATEAVKFLG